MPSLGGGIPEPGLSRIAFVLASVMGSSMIVNRLDCLRANEGDGGVGVGASLLENGSHEGGEIGLLAEIAAFRRAHAGEGVAIVDGGANIGTHTVALAQIMEGWGQVLAFEPQERVFYALAGNIALNNCFNAACVMTALGERAGMALVPKLDHQMPANFGGVSLKPGVGDPGQSTGETVPVPMIALDNLKLKRLDILKLDVEGMEPEVLRGGRQTIETMHPIIFAEVLTCGNVAVARELPGYEIIPLGMNVLAIHRDDPALGRLKMIDNGVVSFNEEEVT